MQLNSLFIVLFSRRFFIFDDVTFSSDNSHCMLVKMQDFFSPLFDVDAEKAILIRWFSAGFVCVYALKMIVTVIIKWMWQQLIVSALIGGQKLAFLDSLSTFTQRSMSATVWEMIFVVFNVLTSTQTFVILEEKDEFDLVVRHSHTTKSFKW